MITQTIYNGDVMHLKGRDINQVNTNMNQIILPLQSLDDGQTVTVTLSADNQYVTEEIKDATGKVVGVPVNYVMDQLTAMKTNVDATDTLVQGVKTRIANLIAAMPAPTPPPAQ
jgi:hypothetical protein